jgi:hypothetical protein
MAMTQTGLLILGGIATLASIGMFLDFDDDATGLLLGVAAAIVWGAFGMASFDVIVRDNYAATASEPMYPLAYLGLAFAAIFGMLVLYQFVKKVGEEAGATDTEGLVSDRR